MMLKLSDQHPNIKEFMVKHLDDFLEHPRDRKLFDLPPRPLNASRVTPKPANEGGPGPGCFTATCRDRASLFWYANSVGHT